MRKCASVAGLALMLAFTPLILRAQRPEQPAQANRTAQNKRQTRATPASRAQPQKPTMPDEPRDHSEHQARAEASARKAPWIDWIVFASIVLVGGTMLSAKRHRGRRPPKLELQTLGSNLAGTKHATVVAVDPPTAPAGHFPADKTITGHPLGAKAGSPSPPPGTAERNERLLQACLEAAAKGMLAGDAVKGRSGWPQSPRPSGLPGDNGLPIVLTGGVHPKALVDTLTALAFAVEAKGPYTTGHSQAVARLAARIALQAGLSASEVEETRLAGLLHDIGKIHVPESVCNKPDRLTAEESELMRSHSAWGAKMLEPLNVKTIERVVRHHHERFDGKGYPDGLAAEKIPLGARIVAVAESFHSMLSDLPYKSARTFEDALAELRRCSGQQFDPRIVMAFLDWIKVYIACAK